MRKTFLIYFFIFILLSSSFAFISLNASAESESAECALKPHFILPHDFTVKQSELEEDNYFYYSPPKQGKAALAFLVLVRGGREFTVSVGDRWPADHPCVFEYERLYPETAGGLRDGDQIYIVYQYLGIDNLFGAYTWSTNYYQVEINNDTYYTFKTYSTVAEPNQWLGPLEAFISDLFHGLADLITAIPGTIFNWIMDAATGAINTLSSLVTGAINAVQGFGVLQPVATTIVAVSIFIGIYIFIKTILYLL